MGHCVSRNVDSGPPTESSSADSRSREASSSSNGDGGGGGGARRRCRGRGRSRGRSSWRREYERRRRQVMSPAGRDVSSSSSSEDSLSATVRKELLFKILVIGDYGVGKTAIVRRYTEGKFSSNYKITIGADFAIKSILWDNKTKINLQLWDIAGHERFGYMTRVYYKYAVAAAIVFDVSRHATFQSIPKWLNDLREKVTLHDGMPIPTVLLANKCDIPNSSIPPVETVNRFCKENGITAWFTTSAKENVNIEEAMNCLIENVIHVKVREASSDAITLGSVSRYNLATRDKPLCCG